MSYIYRGISTFRQQVRNSSFVSFNFKGEDVLININNFDKITLSGKTVSFRKLDNGVVCSKNEENVRHDSVKDAWKSFNEIKIFLKTNNNLLEIK